MRNTPLFPSPTAPSACGGTYGASLHDFYAAYAMQALLSRSKTELELESGHLQSESIQIAIHAHQIAWQMRKFSTLFLQPSESWGTVEPGDIEKLKSLGYENIDAAVQDLISGKLHSDGNLPDDSWSTEEPHNTIVSLWDYIPCWRGFPEHIESEPSIDQKFSEQR